MRSAVLERCQVMQPFCTFHDSRKPKSVVLHHLGPVGCRPQTSKCELIVTTPSIFILEARHKMEPLLEYKQNTSQRDKVTFVYFILKPQYKSKQSAKYILGSSTSHISSRTTGTLIPFYRQNPQRSSKLTKSVSLCWVRVSTLHVT